MGGAGFDPLSLTADASLNQVVIGAAGGPGVAGLRAGLTCSRDALLALAWLRGRIEAAAGTDVTVTFIHDGTAAAATAGSPHSATITAGTWLGGGFRPAHAPPLLDPAPNLRIS